MRVLVWQFCPSQLSYTTRNKYQAGYLNINMKYAFWLVFKLVFRLAAYCKKFVFRLTWYKMIVKAFMIYNFIYSSFFKLYLKCSKNTRSCNKASETILLRLLLFRYSTLLQTYLQNISYQFKLRISHLNANA